jgi:hypothetical protein
MNARNFVAELKRRNVSESRADELARGTEQRPPDRVGVACARSGGFPAAGATWKSPFLDVLPRR